MLEATNVLIDHRYDNASQTKHHKKGQGQNNDKDEDNNNNVSALALMIDGKFYSCEKVGHKSP